MNFTAQLHLDTEATGIRSRITSAFTKRRRKALQRIDREVSRLNFKAALSLLRHLQRQPVGLRAFGTAIKVPKKLSSLDELVINRVNLSYLKPMVDLVMDSIKSCIHCSSQEQHEAGHFLIGYLLGVLPKAYKILSMAEFQKDRFASGSVDVAGFDSLQNLNNFSSVVLGGLVAEHLQFGCITGLHSDVDKLDKVLRWLGYTESEVDDQVRWAALNTVSILHRHNETRSRLVKAMALGRSIGQWIETIENSVVGKEI